MSEQEQPTKTYTQEEVEAAVKERLSKKNQQLDQKEQERLDALRENEELRQQLEAELKKANPSAPLDNAQVPIETQTAQMQQPQQQSMTQEQVNEQIQHHLAEQKKQEEIAQIIGKGANEDEEFKKLASSSEANAIPYDYTQTLISTMGEDALPVLKKALQDKSVHSELVSFSDPTQLVAWAYRQKGKIVKPHDDDKSFSPKPDVSNAGTSPTDFDDDDLSSYVGNMTV